MVSCAKWVIWLHEAPACMEWLYYACIFGRRQSHSVFDKPTNLGWHFHCKQPRSPLGDMVLLSSFTFSASTATKWDLFLITTELLLTVTRLNRTSTPEKLLKVPSIRFKVYLLQGSWTTRARRWAAMRWTDTCIKLYKMSRSPSVRKELLSSEQKRKLWTFRFTCISTFVYACKLDSKQSLPLVTNLRTLMKLVSWT